jgi:hypothetical protein
LLRVGAHYAISSLFEDFLEDTEIGCYQVKKGLYEREEAGKLKLVTGKMKIFSEVTWEEEEMNFAVLHLGDNNVNGGVIKYQNQQQLNNMQAEIRAAFDRGDVSEVIKLMGEHFGPNNYTLWHLFRDQQRKILNQILQITYENIESSYRQIYDNNYSIMSFFQSLNIPVPKPLLLAAENILNLDLQRIFENEIMDTDRLSNIINDIKRWSVNLNEDMVRFVANTKVNSILEELANQPNDIETMLQVEIVLNLLDSLGIKLRFWKAQNTFFSIGKDVYSEMQAKADHGEKSALTWLEVFNKIGDYLRIELS